MVLRSLACLVSLALHGALALFFFLPSGGAALESGTGEDMFVVEQGIAVEGVTKLGDAETTTEAVEAPPEVSQAKPPIEEVKPVEEETQVVGSKAGPEQDIVDDPKPKEVKQPRRPQVATLEQPEVRQEERESSGAQKAGGETTARSAYLGTLRSHLETKKVNPHSRQIGTVVVRFMVDGSGQVLSREVSASSGSRILDDAAIATIDRAAPFPPMPSSVASAPLVVNVPFKFSVR
jgi:protein TonB